MFEYPKVRFQYKVPKHFCAYCGYQINPGKDMYRITESFGKSKIACKLCALKVKLTGKISTYQG